ncbi:MAG TPA: tetratricopeptide repeat protein [Flavobacteriaceae bacterium]|nr:tetratricopeptide repeat protein [Flavobacteriaceae bacterium]
MRSPTLFSFLFFVIGLMSAQVDYVDDTQAVLDLLHTEKEKHRLNLTKNPSQSYSILSRLQDLGDRSFVLSEIQDSRSLNEVEKVALLAREAWYTNDFFKMEKLLSELSEFQKEDVKVQRLLATLEIEAWELENAEVRTRNIWKQNKEDLETELVLARTLILQKKYEEALTIAEDRIAKNPDQSAGYFMKADVYFWNQNPDKAEMALKQGLQIDPLNADARFYYGYAIWRRIDATQIDDMVAQWEIALALNPLHFQTHWHMGNGHTNKTFVDYADPNEEEIRLKLGKADSLFTNGNKYQALAHIKQVASDYPTSVIPDMHYASILYSDFDAENRKANLAEAANIFLNILKTKEHYGPAHNGLSAVIKSQRIPYLSSFEATQNALLHADITNLDDMLELFPDVAYYPGDIAKGMVWNQLYTSVVYFPFLVAQDRSFIIPPLHEDLAIAMNNSYFRYNTTFDNRQWMDIRGVGSGAASIEYTERGAYGERNVLLHEYVHLFHMLVTTDEQNRKIRELYYNAMENDLTLDYYSQNNESEYFAQTYPAYFEEVKVHPLDFKSINNTSDLKRKDPEMYAFLDDLVAKEKAYLNGDEKAMASNWAQVYVNLANKSVRENSQKVYKKLQTALEYDPRYLPAHLAYAKQLLREKKYDEAYAKLGQAKHIDSNYAPIYMVEAEWLKATKPEAINEHASLYKKAYDMETDYMEKANNSGVLRSFYYNHALLPEALVTAEEYVKNGSSISTYLRDRKEAAASFSAWQRALLGEEEQIEVLADLVSQRPHNYTMRVQLAEALLANQKYDEVVEVLLPSYKNLQASRVNRTDFELLLAEAYQGLREKEKMQNYLERILEGDMEKMNLDSLYKLRLASFLVRQGEVEKALSYIKDLSMNGNSQIQASLSFVEAQVALEQAKETEAIRLLKQSLEKNPYHVDAIKTLEILAVKNTEAQKLWEDYKGNIHH